MKSSLFSKSREVQENFAHVFQEKQTKTKVPRERQEFLERPVIFEVIFRDNWI